MLKARRLRFDLMRNKRRGLRDSVHNASIPNFRCRGLGFQKLNRGLAQGSAVSAIDCDRRSVTLRVLGPSYEGGTDASSGCYVLHPWLLETAPSYFWDQQRASSRSPPFAHATRSRHYWNQWNCKGLRNKYPARSKPLQPHTKHPHFGEVQRPAEYASKAPIGTRATS